MTRCLRSSILAFWAHISRGWHPFQALQRIKPSPQAHLVAQTGQSAIYVTHRGPPRAMKVIQDARLLSHDFRLHVHVEAVFKKLQEDFRRDGIEFDLPFVPECLGIYPDITSSSVSDIFQHVEGFPKTSGGYMMEYIHPLSEHHTKYLVRRHLTKSVQDRAVRSLKNGHFIAKVYLGDIKPLSDRWNANLHGRAAYVDHLSSERVEVRALAATMGATLAILHWSCGVDGRGVEFVLGRDNRGIVQLWLIDFADCKRFLLSPDGVTTQLVGAVMDNEPFWPRDMNIQGVGDLWGYFRNAYMEVSGYIMRNERRRGIKRLPPLFMDELEKLRGPGAP